MFSENRLFHDAQIKLTFTGVDDDGDRIRRDVAAVAKLMELPEARIKLMLHRALRAIPLVADEEPITVSAVMMLDLSCASPFCHIICVQQFDVQLLS